MSKFIPFDDKIQVQPITKPSLLVSDDNQFEEMGTVIAVGSKVKFVNVGDILYFTAWGLFKTPEIDGERYWVVPETSEFILGKETKNGRKKPV